MRRFEPLCFWPWALSAACHPGLQRGARGVSPRLKKTTQGAFMPHSRGGPPSLERRPPSRPLPLFLFLARSSSPSRPLSISIYLPLSLSLSLALSRSLSLSLALSLSIVCSLSLPLFSSLSLSLSLSLSSSLSHSLSPSLSLASQPTSKPFKPTPPTLVKFGRFVLLGNCLCRHVECTNGSPLV